MRLVVDEGYLMGNEPPIREVVSEKYSCGENTEENKEKQVDGSNLGECGGKQGTDSSRGHDILLCRISLFPSKYPVRSAVCFGCF